MHDELQFLRCMLFQAKPNAGKARCEPGWHWRPLPLSDYDLWYAMSGKGRMRVDGREYPIRKGSCFLIRPGDCPDAVQEDDDRLTVIFMHFEARDAITGQICEPEPLPQRHTFISDPFLFEMMLGRLLQCAQQDGKWHDAEYDLLIKMVFLHLLRTEEQEQAESAADKQRRIVAALKAHIREEPGRRLDHRELAALVKLSPEYVSVIFKKQTGTSLKSYMTDVRMERAMHLLMETPMNVTEVAEALGYANVYLFSKLFKKRYGEPPSRFKWVAEHAKPHGGDARK